MFFYGCYCSTQAQSVTVKTNRTQILIGERIEYQLSLNLPSDGYGIGFRLPDSILHFDIIDNQSFDTVNNNGAVLITKKIIFTSFDSGSWHIPSLEILIDKNGSRGILHTDSLLVNVGYSAADSTGQLRDIKPLMEVTIKDYTWIYAAAAIVVILAALLLYYYYRKRKQKQVPVFHSKLSPYEEAIKALEALQQYDTGKAGQVKAYHAELTHIFKRYYSRKISKDLMSKTTAEILTEIKTKEVTVPLLSTISELLCCADAVKFAKYIPGQQELGRNLEVARDIIEQLEKNITGQNIMPSAV